MALLIAAVTFLWYGVSHLVGVVFFLVVELWQRVYAGLVVLLAVTENVGGEIYSVEHRRRISLVASCNLERRSHLRGRADDRQSGCVVHPGVGRDGPERGKPLVVVHRQDTVEVVVVAGTEELIGGVWTESLYVVLH